jgi:hypothetical protein
MKTVGIVLLALGLVMTSITGFTVIKREKVIDIGELEVYDKQRTPVYWSPVTGAVLAAAGIVLLVMAYSNNKKKSAAS